MSTKINERVYTNLYYFCLNKTTHIIAQCLILFVLFFRLVQEEIEALSHIAENIKQSVMDSELSVKNSLEVSTQQDSVDLDNIFAFLGEGSETTCANILIEEINDKMNHLVQDLDQEVSIYI